MEGKYVVFQPDSNLQDVLKLIQTKKSQGCSTGVIVREGGIDVISDHSVYDEVISVSEGTTVADICRELRDYVTKVKTKVGDVELGVSISLRPGPDKTITVRFCNEKKREEYLTQRRKSRSLQVKERHNALVQAASEQLNVELKPQKIEIPGSPDSVDVYSGYGASGPPILAIASASIDGSSSAQPDNVADGILRLTLVKDLCQEFHEADLYILFPIQSPRVSSLLQRAAEVRGVKLLPVNIRF